MSLQFGFYLTKSQAKHRPKHCFQQHVLIHVTFSRALINKYISIKDSPNRHCGTKSNQKGDINKVVREPYLADNSTNVTHPVDSQVTHLYIQTTIVQTVAYYV